MDDVTKGRIERYRHQCGKLLELAARTKNHDSKRHYLILAANFEMRATHLEGGFTGKPGDEPGSLCNHE
jgi:hypothetical protein